MVTQVVVDKAGDKEIAVVIPLLYTHLERVMGADAGLFEAAGFQLITEEIVIAALVDQDG